MRRVIEVEIAEDGTDKKKKKIIKVPFKGK